MSEIKKMYENAGVEKSKCWDDCTTCTRTSCDKTISYIKAEYPPFTAEKVLKVIVFFLNKGIKLDFSIKENTKISVENFKECIAQIVAKYWQDLTEEEKQQVKGILE